MCRPLLFANGVIQQYSPTPCSLRFLFFSLLSFLSAITSCNFLPQLLTHTLFASGDTSVTQETEDSTPMKCR
jgi:hypothetical protein